MGLTADQATRTMPMLLAGVILTGGFALVVHLSPRGQVTLPDFVPRPSSEGSGTPSEGPAWESSDWLALSDSMRVLNHLSNEEPTDRDEQGTPIEGDVPQPGPGTNPDPKDDYLANFQFVGTISMGDRSVALLSLDGGAQRFVGPDERIGTHTIVSVHPDHIIVRVDGMDRRMNLTDKGRSKLDSSQRYLSDRDRLIEQQRLNRDRLRTNGSVSSPDIGDGR